MQNKKEEKNSNHSGKTSLIAPFYVLTTIIKKGKKKNFKNNVQ